MRIETSHGHADMVHHAGEIDRQLWAKSFAGHCLDGRYYELVEETLPFDFRYAVMANRRTGAAAVQPFFLIAQEITAGLPKRWRSLLSRAAGLFRFKLLVVGCGAGEGRPGSVEPWFLESLDEALGVLARRERARLVVFKDFPSEYREAFRVLLRRGYRRLASMPSTRLDLGFASFEEYLQTRMSAGIRSHLRRKLRDSDRQDGLSLEVARDPGASLGEMVALYLQTHERSDFRFERLNAAYFAGLAERFPDRALFFQWRKEGRLVAFTACMVHGGVLRYLNLGMDYAQALKLNLYFCVWRDLVRWALDHRLRAIEAGQLNYEAKFRLGLRLLPLDLYVRASPPLLNGLFGWCLPWFEPARYEPSLRKFAK